MCYRDFSMIILAGGRSCRMGCDKADLLWEGQTFLLHQIRKGQMLGIEDIQISGYRGSRCPLPVTPDRFPERGPLAGMEACLRRAVHPRCLILSVDMPLLPISELERLLDASKTMSLPVILKNNGREQPLAGVYSVDLAEGMEQELRFGKGSVFAFLNRNGYSVCESQAPPQWFSNFNSPEEYFQNLCLSESGDC